MEMKSGSGHQAFIVLLLTMFIVTSEASYQVDVNDYYQSNLITSEIQEINITLIDPVNDVTHYNKSTGALIQENATNPDFDILNVSVTTGPVNYTMVMHINGHFNMSGDPLPGTTPYFMNLLFEYHWTSSVTEDVNGTVACTMEQLYVSSDMFSIFNQYISVIDNDTGTLSVTFPRSWIPDIGNPILGYPIENFFLKATVRYLEPSGSFIEFEDTLDNAVPSNTSGGSDNNGSPGGDPLLPVYIVTIIASTFSVIIIILMRKRKERPLKKP